MSGSLGFFGKLPLMGDYTRRRLPEDFIRPWADWIQWMLVSSQKQLGREWTDVYATSPIWRFAVSSGNFGQRPWTGIVMPSVDSAGRYYPMTIAGPCNEQHQPMLFISLDEWFERLERLSLSILEKDFNLDEFDRKLRAFAAPETVSSDLRIEERELARDAHRFSFCAELEEFDATSPAVIGLSGCLISRYLSKYSIWHTRGSDIMGPSLYVYEGLPDSATFLLLGKKSLDSL